MQDRIDAVREKLRQEIEDVTHELEVDLPKRIDEARQKGDLSENAEYESAKDRQNYLAARVLQLQNRHGELVNIDIKQVDSKSVGLYSAVDIVEIESGKSYTYELVLPDEMDIRKGMISIMSPIGQQLRGKKAGAKVTIKTPVRTFDVKVMGFTNILGERFEKK
jgi:transcription elongation factor GreA